MKLQTKLSRNGNSWYVRLAAPILRASGLKPDSEIFLVVTPGRVTIYSTAAAKKLAGKDQFEASKQDARKAWNEAFEQVWLDIFGTD
jgi:antitoxin component of MazEF toxin-antitoxin module